MQVPIDPVLVTGFVLALVRATAWVFVVPPLNTRSIPIPVKLGIAASLALVAAPHVSAASLPIDDTAAFVGALITQVFAGLALGFVAYLFLSVFQAAGSLIDTFAGYNSAAIYDPISGSSVPVFGRFYQVLATTLLFAVDGHLLLVRGFLHSFDGIPLEGARLGQLDRLLTTDLATFLVAAIEIAAPILGVLFVTELALGVLSRAAPQMNVFALGFTIRVIVALGLVSVAIPLLGPAFRNLVTEILRQWAALTR